MGEQRPARDSKLGRQRPGGGHEEAAQTSAVALGPRALGLRALGPRALGLRALGLLAAAAPQHNRQEEEQERG